MFLSRSLARVRPLGPFGLGRPYILDYKRGIMKPCFGTGEWDRTKDGRTWKNTVYGWLPRYPTLEDLRLAYLRMLPPPGSLAAFSGFVNFGGPFIGVGGTLTYSLNTLALDSAYTYNSAGDAIGSRIPMVAAKTFDTVYFQITTYTGTAANVNDITVEVRNDSSDKPGSTQHDVVIKDPASATGWIATSGFTFAGSANTIYWVTVADPDGNGTDNATVSRGVNANPFSGGSIFVFETAHSTNGFSTMASSGAGLSAGIVVKYSDGTVVGNPYANQTNSGSSTNKRGLYVSDGFTESIKVFGLASMGGGTQLSSALILEGTAAPDDAAATTFSVPIGLTGTEQGFVGTPYTVPKATAERFVFDYGSGGTVPQMMNIGTGTDANLRKAMLGSGNWYWAEEDQTGSPDDWDNDNISAFPKMAVLIEDFVAGAGGGSGGGHIIGGTVVR